MPENLKVIREALDEISVSGKRNIVLMNLCMDGLDAEIKRLEEREKPIEND